MPQSSVKVTNVGASLLPAMLSGKVDATLGAFWNVEGVELRQRKQRPWIVPVNRLGVPDYDELVLVANADKLDDQRDDLRLFISARSRGAREARRDPRAAADRAARGEPGPEAQADRARACASRFPRCFPRRAIARTATSTRSQWRNYGGWMVDNGLLKDLPDIDAALTNDLLPGEGL